MLIIKKVDNYLNIIIATILNIEYGVKKYNTDLTILPEPWEPMLTVTLPQTNTYANPVKFKIHSRFGFIYCLLDHMSIDQFIKIIKSKLRMFPAEHLTRNVTGMSISTIVSQNLTENASARKFISNHASNEPIISGFTWYVTGLSDQIYSPHVYSKLKQIIPMISSIMFDEIDVFNFEHYDIVNKISVSNMKIPKLPDNLITISDSMQNDQIGILINHDTYEIEFISQFSAIMCTTLQSDHMRVACNKYMAKWSAIKKELAFNSSCEYDCFVCKFPVCNDGFIVSSLTNCNDYIDDDFMEIYYTYIDPILNHFVQSDKKILLCSHCVRIIKYLSRLQVILNYAMIRIPINYKQLINLSPTTKDYAKLLEYADIGRESRIIKVTLEDKQFYFVNRKDLKNILVKDSNVRHSNLPLIPITMFWYNSDIGYR